MAPNSDYAYDKSKALVDEERKGLLANVDDSADISEPELQARPLARKRIVVTAAVLIALLVTGAFARTLLLSSPVGRQIHPSWFTGDEIRSNGTHDFQRTVLIVSIDGLRYVCIVLYASRGPDAGANIGQTILTVVSHHISLTSVNKGYAQSPCNPSFQ